MSLVTRRAYKGGRKWMGGVMVVPAFTLIVASLIAGALLPTAVQAAYPGGNGALIFASHRQALCEPCGTFDLFATDSTGDVLRRLTGPSGSAQWYPSVAADGRTMVWVRDNELVLGTVDGQVERVLTPNRYQVFSPAISPDGSRVAYARVDGSSGAAGLFVLDLMSGVETLVGQASPAGHVNDRDPAWSPDGSRLAYTHIEAATPKVWVINADGSGARKLLDDTVPDSNPDWSPDGARLVIQRPVLRDSEGRAPSPALYAVAQSGSDLRLVVEIQGRDPVYSPDGSMIAYADDTPAPALSDIHIVNVDGSDDRAVASDPAWDATPTWQPLPYRYGLSDWRAPLDEDAVNVAKAGQTIPVKWRLSGIAGDPVAEPTAIQHIASHATAACGAQTNDSIESLGDGAGLRYLGDGEWIFNWKTEKSYLTQCRVLTLTLDDGQTKTALFQFN